MSYFTHISNHRLIKWVYILLFWTTTVSITAAQGAKSSSETSRAQTAIHVLKNGTLLVRLQSNQKKINALKENLSQQNMTDKSRKYLEKMLTATTAETQLVNKSIINSFKENYTFSDVLFLYDYDMSRVNAGERQGYFLRSDFTIDTTLSLPDTPFLIAQIGRIDVETSIVYGLVITDAQSKHLKSPFPYAQKMGGFFYNIERIFSGDNAIKKHYNKVIQRLNIKLAKYYKITQKDCYPCP